MELRNRAMSEERQDSLSLTSGHNEQINDGVAENALATLNSSEESPNTHEDVNSTVMEAEAKAAAEPSPVNDTIVHNDDDSSDGGDEHMADEDLGSVSGGFLGDFEEIEEDEDVQRFISLNHTPLPSARQSPAPLHLPQKAGASAAQAGAEPMDVEENESGDESDGSFESIPEIATRATMNVDTVDTVDVSMAVETMESPALEAEAAATTGGEESTVQTPRSTKYNGTETETGSSRQSEGTSIERLRILRDEFRDQFIPKLADGVFFSPDVYKRYTVVSTSDTTLNNGTPSVAGSTEAASKPVQTTQKPSSLRRNANTNHLTTAAAQKSAEKQGSALNSAVTSDSEKPDAGNHDVAANADPLDASSAIQPQSILDKQPVSRPRSPSTAAPKAKRMHANVDDDVIGTLLGVMNSPKAGNSIQQQTKAAASLQQNIPSDMLTAMMAIEGLSALETPKPAAVRAPGRQISAKEFAAKLPGGYKGPFSQMSTAEHAHFLGLVQKVRAGQLNAKENIEYQRFKTKIDAEQLKFRTQAREKSFPLLRYISEPVSQAAYKRLSELSGRALEHYVHRYTPVRVAAIRSSASGYTPLVYMETLLQRGKCYGVQMPSIERMSAEGTLSMTDDPWGCKQSDDKLVRKMGMPVTSDSVALKLARLVQADVVVSASSLIALLTLPQSYMRDVAIPFKVIASQADADKPARSILLVDKPLMSTHASTPRKLNQMFYETCASSRLVDRSQQLELGGGTKANSVSEAAVDGSDSADQVLLDNSNYTLWEFGGLRVIVRYGVHGFHAPDSAKNADREGVEGAKPPVTTTVTVKTKLEYYLGNNSAEVAVASCGGTERLDGAYEDITESERLSWWMSCYLRGSPSEVWVSHVDVLRSSVAQVTKHTCADLCPGTAPLESGASNTAGSGASAGGPQPSTRGLLALLQDLHRQPAGAYMLVHKRRTWDATIYRALEQQPEGVSPATSPRASTAIMNLEEELKTPSAADLTQLDLEGDYVPACWRGLSCQIPYTYAPADLAEFCAPMSTWNSSSGASGNPNQRARSRKRAAKKRKNAKTA